MYNTFWQHALFVRGQSFSVKTFDRSRNGCQVIRLGAGNDFCGPSGQALPLPSRVSFSRANFFLCPLLPKCLLRLFSISITFYKTICNRFRNLDTCLTYIDTLKFIPGEARDLLRIAPKTVIDLPEGRHLFKDFVKVKRWTDQPLAVRS